MDVASSCQVIALAGASEGRWRCQGPVGCSCLLGGGVGADEDQLTMTPLDWLHFLINEAVGTLCDCMLQADTVRTPVLICPHVKILGNLEP